MKTSLLAFSVISAISFGAFANHLGEGEEHLINYSNLLEYKGKPASEHTIAANNAFSKKLPWDDRSVIERQKHGLIAEFGDHPAGEILRRYAFLDGAIDVSADAVPETVNPSIYHQAAQNFLANGLYQVADGVYQLRGADVTNLTFYRTDNGYVVHDPALTVEAVQHAMDFARTHLPKINGEVKVTGVLYSHNHIDHFGGVRGLWEDGKLPEGVPVIGPRGFLKELIDEGILAGNAMNRRSQYQYGTTLTPSETGIVDSAIGLGAFGGNMSLILPTEEVQEDTKVINIDGVDFEITNVPYAEAPAGMIVWVEKYSSLNTGELTYDGMHNLYTLRGAKVRDGLLWSKYLAEMLVNYGDRVDHIVAAHSAPVISNEYVNHYLALQRDNYGFIHNQSLRLANHGVNINDVGRKLEQIVPQSQEQAWFTNGYHGSYSHNARAVLNLYLGYYDSNPANLNPLLTQEKSCTYVKASGADTMFNAAKEHFSAGRYQQATMLFNDLVQCEPNNVKYRLAMADSLEQQGYQSETMAWRNSYLQGAYELRTNEIKDPIKTTSADVLANTPTSAVLDLLAVRLNAPKAEELAMDVSFQIVHPDIEEVYYGTIANANMSSVKVSDKQDNVDMTVTIDRADLTRVLLGRATFEQMIKFGVAKIEGQADILNQLNAILDDFSLDFEVLPMPSKAD
ncbi:MBL fold metallo-hydrolase [Photobacterium sp. BZF1]|uniref:alkyl/aryl-sulfatase n=1 Tax=Photobacterium sp. BZF1 TaxID=1904457 RepID=UPI001653A623|nr:alkyl sulfatase dimerization domain-containing protein [Photobacterium sp. BZF1]MBC7001002.1 MBL fold metallo-hydrolase [Photobacterium sp. BZF1]